MMILFQTPLHNAAGNGYEDIVEILLRNGANINEKTVRMTSFWRNREERRERERAGERERENGTLLVCFDLKN
jgi:ankyrin repeat protein